MRVWCGILLMACLVGRGETAPAAEPFCEKSVVFPREGQDSFRIPSMVVATQGEVGIAGYSDLAVLADGTFLCLYETGRHGPQESLNLARFNLAWIRE